MSYKCSICYKSFQLKDDIIQHTEKKHADQIPENMSVAQFIYAQNHDGRTTGFCRFCHRETEWSDKLGKPRQICGRPECAALNVKLCNERTKKIHGMTGAEMLLDPENQKRMLANRKISGIYNWSDGIHKFTYTGSYEKFIIEWIDKVMGLDPETIQMPGLIIPYEYRGKMHSWITDIYLSDFNLIVEVKDGMENKNEGLYENREKEKAKDETMRKQKEFNYVKVTHKNVMQLVKALSEIRMNNILEKDNKTNFISINESSEYPEGVTASTNIINNLRKDYQDELTAIIGYEEHADMCKKEGLIKAAEVLRDISIEERVHCGELGELLKKYDNNYEKSLNDGYKEAKETMNESASVTILNAIRKDLQGEFDAIKNYEAHAEYAANNHYEDIVKVVTDIAKEEKVHVGELIELLSIYDKELSSSIDDGEKEAKETMNESTSIENIDKRTWRNDDIHYYVNPEDGVCNASVMYNGKRSRLRAGILIVKGNQVLLGEESDEKGVFSLPGGGLDENETPIEAAVREAKEEVRVNVRNARETGFDYCEINDTVKPWVKEHIPESEWWYSYYTCLVIGDYAGKYTGNVKDIDKDENMMKTAKFYTISDVINKPSFKDQWKKALIKFGYYKSNEILTESAKRDNVKERKSDMGIVPDTCPSCGSKIGLYFRGEPVWCCSNKKCNKYFGTLLCENAVGGMTTLSNEKIDSMCDVIYEQGSGAQELDQLIPTMEEKPKKDKYDLIADKYFTNEDVFDDGKGLHAPIGMPFMPDQNFTEKNEDCQQDPAASGDPNVLSSIAMDTLNSGLQMRENAVNNVNTQQQQQKQQIPQNNPKVLKLLELKEALENNLTRSISNMDRIMTQRRLAEIEKQILMEQNKK